MERIAFDDHPWFVVFNTNHGHQLSSSLRFPNVYQTYSKRQSITKLLRNSDDVYLFRSLYVRKTFEKRSENDRKTFLKRNKNAAKTKQKRCHYDRLHRAYLNITIELNSSVPRKGTSDVIILLNETVG